MAPIKLEIIKIKILIQIKQNQHKCKNGKNKINKSIKESM